MRNKITWLVLSIVIPISMMACDKCLYDLDREIHLSFLVCKYAEDELQMGYISQHEYDIKIEILKTFKKARRIFQDNHL